MPPSFASFSSFSLPTPAPASPASVSQPPTKKKHKHKKSHQPKEESKQESQSSHQDPFYSHRKGDPGIVQYGKADNVPRYNHVARGKKILGLPTCYVVHRTENAVEVAADGHGRSKKGSELTDDQARRLLAHPPVKRIVQPPPTLKYEEVNGVIHIPTSKPRSRPHPTREGEHDASDESSINSESEDEDIPTIHLTAQQETIKSLEDHLSQHPNSIPTWLSLLSQMLSITPRNASQARAEITLSVLIRCFSSHPSNASSKHLWLEYLTAGEELWDLPTLTSKWEEALAKVGDVDMWMEWVNWKVRTTPEGMDDCIECVKRAMAAVDVEVGKVRLFWRIAVLFREAGYTERATALFQAQAELLFNRPHHLADASFPHVLESLEEFWDSEVPRFGEQDAPGWQAWYDSGEPINARDTPHTQPPAVPLSTQSDPYSLWSATESAQDQSAIFSTRTSDLSEDPYSTVLLADVQDLLVDLRTSHAKAVFRKVWLSFVGLPIPGFTASLSDLNWDDKWACQHLATSKYLAAIVPDDQHVLFTDSVAGATVGREQQYLHSFGPIVSWTHGMRRPLDSVIDGKGEAGSSFWSQRDLESLDVNFVRRLFAGLKLSSEGDAEWDFLSLAFENLLKPKPALKLSRTILSANQTSLSHWANHALLERSRHKFDEARKIYDTLLPSPDPSQSLLWWDWAELEWLSGKKDEVIKIILHSAGITGSGGVHILRAKSGLEGWIRSDGGRWTVREAWVKLRALLELIITGDPALAMEIYDQFLPLTEDNLARESLIVSGLVMLYRHALVLKNPTPPTLLQTRAREMIRLYPSNSVVLGVLLESEKGCGIFGHWKELRAGRTEREENDLVESVGELWVSGWKKGRWRAEVERVRDGLMSVLEGSRLKGSTTLWRMAVEVEIRAGDFKRAKKLLYRALGDCPFSKELYLLSFGPLRSVFEQHELTLFGARMTEQVRLRVGFDEIAGLDDAGSRSDLDEMEWDGGGDDDQSKRAQERRRLMPY